MNGLDCTIIMNPKVWEASGHVGGFQDPMQSCLFCRKLYRADQVWDQIVSCAWVRSLLDLYEPGAAAGVTGADLKKWSQKKGKKYLPK